MENFYTPSCMRGKLIVKILGFILMIGLNDPCIGQNCATYEERAANISSNVSELAPLILYYDKAIECYIEEQKWEDVLLLLNRLVLRAIEDSTLDFAFERLKENDRTIGFYKIDSMVYMPRKTVYPPQILRALWYQHLKNWGLYYYEKGEYLRALEAYTTLDKIIQKDSIGFSDLDTRFLLASCKKDIGLTFKRIRDYSESKDYIRQSIVLFKRLPLNYQGDLPFLRKHQGDTYMQLKQPDTAGLYYKGALTKIKSAYQADPNNFKKKNRLISLYNAWALALRDLGQLDSAMLLLNQSKAIHLPNDPNLMQTNRILGDVHTEKGAIKMGLKYYQKAMVRQVFGFSPQENENPDLTSVVSKKELLNTLKSKANALYRNYLEDTENHSDLKLSWETYQLAVSLIDSIKITYDTDTDIKNLVLDNFDIYTQAVNTGYELYKKKGSDEIINSVFQVVEKSRDIFLLRALQDLKGIESVSISPIARDSLLRLKRRISTMERGLEAPDIAEANEVGYSEKLARLKQLRKDYFVLINEVRKKDPHFFGLKYRNDVVDIRKAQEKLLAHSGQLVIEYFTGSDGIYLIGFNQNKQVMEKVGKGVLEEVDQFLRTVQMINSTRVFQPDFIQAFEEDGHSIYEKLISPILKHFGDVQIDELIIVPDGSILTSLPFETLATIKNADVQSYQDISYLITSYAVNYFYSSTWAVYDREMKRDDREIKYLFAGFAPEFNTQTKHDFCGLEDNLTNLDGVTRNPTEAFLRTSYYNDGHLYKGKKVTTSFLLKNAPEFKILHIDTHACANNTSPLESKLFLADSSISLLSIFNLLKLNSKLVVLAACETGIGNYEPGYGVVSLARGFAYAGSPSMITTLWKARDDVTKDILSNFYSYLDDGLSKNVALQKAKLDYLRSDRKKESFHPYLWASFIQTGDPASIFESSFICILLIIAIIIFLLVGGVYMARSFIFK